MTTPAEMRNTQPVSTMPIEKGNQEKSSITLERVIAIAATITFVVSVYFGSVATGGLSLVVLIYLALQYCCCSDDLPQRMIVPGSPGQISSITIPSSNMGNVPPLQAGRVSSPLNVSSGPFVMNGVFPQTAQSQGMGLSSSGSAPTSSSTVLPNFSSIHGTSPQSTQGTVQSSPGYVSSVISTFYNGLSWIFGTTSPQEGTTGQGTVGSSIGAAPTSGSTASPGLSFINGTFPQGVPGQVMAGSSAGSGSTSNVNYNFSLISGQTSPRGSNGHGEIIDLPFEHLPDDVLFTPEMATAIAEHDALPQPAGTPPKPEDRPDVAPAGRRRNAMQRNKFREIIAFTRLLQEREALRRHLPGNSSLSLEQQRQRTNALLTEVVTIREERITEISNRIRTLRLEIDGLKRQLASLRPSSGSFTNSRPLPGNQYLADTQPPLQLNLTVLRAPSMNTVTLPNSGAAPLRTPSSHRLPSFTPTLAPIAERGRAQPQQAQVVPLPPPTPGMSELIGAPSPMRTPVAASVTAPHTEVARLATIRAQWGLKADELLRRVNGQVIANGQAVPSSRRNPRRQTLELRTQLDRMDQDAAGILTANPGLNNDLGEQYNHVRQRIYTELYVNRRP